ncbi:hypothetical protein TTHERM_000037427 (macronuclear) [Tetrahymena thermophila SB210]|uniref:Uncharacterized protein n=1 Tax=Tetrahymena thermophila (strain SB210) TaxID=312017 RepID=W7XKG9_TETTS|nr:hypothetical protein TTHERM_000037427 [Tetrahymena thermophila SB210]EWS74894.1 hypothetical protein TTHERM_000037427 [Tetrahymena thermophila SB210]|eukprot:XP_012652607.1 hypothetical protein TTHERM_000037427 [Tetrahymena thermophila SB210]
MLSSFYNQIHNQCDYFNCKKRIKMKSKLKTERNIRILLYKHQKIQRQKEVKKSTQNPINLCVQKIEIKKEKENQENNNKLVHNLYLHICQNKQINNTIFYQFINKYY